MFSGQNPRHIIIVLAMADFPNGRKFPVFDTLVSISNEISVTTNFFSFVGKNSFLSNWRMARWVFEFSNPRQCGITACSQHSRAICARLWHLRRPRPSCRSAHCNWCALFGHYPRDSVERNLSHLANRELSKNF